MKNSAISWTHHTFNPWIGCTKISEGCDHCYAERDWDHRKHLVKWGHGKKRHRTSRANWLQPIRWDVEAQRTGKRRRVFCASLADIFDPEVPDAWRSDLFALIKRCPNLDWMLLTKRSGFMDEYFINFRDQQWPWPHVALGVSVESQNTVFRADELALIPAARRFISFEPMIEPIKCNPWMWRADEVIVGGESGPGARPLYPDMVRSVRDACMARGVSFCFKQWGDAFPLAYRDVLVTAGYDPTLPRGGRMLDSCIWVGAMAETGKDEMLKALHLGKRT